MQLALLQVAQHRTNSGRLGRLCPEAWPGVLEEVTHLRGTPTCRREGLGKAGAMRLAAKGEWVFLPPRRAGWHMGSSLVPPRDPQAQTPFPSQPVARRMDFLSGARALWGLRRSLIFARGEGHQRADISSPPQSESRTRAWQVMGRLRMRFLVVCGMHKRRAGQGRKRRHVDACGSQDAVRSPQAAVLQLGQPQHPQVPCLE